MAPRLSLTIRSGACASNLRTSCVSVSQLPRSSQPKTSAVIPTARGLRFEASRSEAMACQLNSLRAIYRIRARSRDTRRILGHWEREASDAVPRRKPSESASVRGEGACPRSEQAGRQSEMVTVDPSEPTLVRQCLSQQFLAPLAVLAGSRRRPTQHPRSFRPEIPKVRRGVSTMDADRSSIDRFGRLQQQPHVLLRFPLILSKA
jgi:hypothetical protein